MRILVDQSAVFAEVTKSLGKEFTGRKRLEIEKEIRWATRIIHALGLEEYHVQYLGLSDIDAQCAELNRTLASTRKYFQYWTERLAITQSVYRAISIIIKYSEEDND